MRRPGWISSPGTSKFQEAARLPWSTDVGTDGPGAAAVNVCFSVEPHQICADTAGATVFAAFATGNTRSTPARPATSGTEPSRVCVLWTMYAAPTDRSSVSRGSSGPVPSPHAAANASGTTAVARAKCRHADERRGRGVCPSLEFDCDAVTSTTDLDRCTGP